MTWPQATDYNAAVQNPRLCFGDDDLRGGQIVGDLLGLPRPHSGNFADVYQIQSADKQSWAVKCFTRPVTGLRPRYQAITDHLCQTQRAFMVEFRYLDEGICIRGQWFPIVKMRWVEGFTLNDFIRQHLDKPGVLERLAQMWIRLGQELRDAGMAHGDLQHGNVLLAPGSKSGLLALKLIDYDGMFVPALAQTPSGEVGHPNYQHPQRLRESIYGRDMDRFSHLLIYTALRSLRIGGADLWQRYDSQENLLFREEDFRQPGQSRLLRELWHWKDRDVRDLVGRLLLASQGPLPSVPALEELVDEKVVRPLTGNEETRVNALLDAGPPASRPSRASFVTIVPATMATKTGKRKTAALAVLDPKETVDAALETITETPPVRPMPPPLPRRAPPPLSQAYSPDVSPRLAPLLSLLSRPVALAVLGATALIGFLFVNLLVWSFAQQPPPTPQDTRAARLLPIPDVLLKGGYKKEIELHIERDACDDPLTIQVDGLPPELAVPALKLPPEQEKAALLLLAPLNFDLPERDVFLSLWRDGQRIDEQHFRLSVSRVARPLLHPPESIHCRAGQSLVFTGQVERRECLERLSLLINRLPAGVRQESLPAAGNDMPRVKLTVAPDARLPDSAPLSLTLRVGDAIADSKPLRLIVENPAPRVTPKKEKTPAASTVAKNDATLLTKKAEAKTERVTFGTVDHVQLVGTLYTGSKGKRGACVLMLHELEKDCSAAGWRRLAEALQADGHTVLTFDFRGHGASKRVAQGFWSSPVNIRLPEYRQSKWEDGLPETISARNFPPSYLPWLLHDIAAARAFLDLRHDDPHSPVNSSNLVLLGVGRGAALGSLWLATEGFRYETAVDGTRLDIIGNQHIARAIWLGIETNWKEQDFPLQRWTHLAHRPHPEDRVVPIDFVFGAADVNANRLARLCVASDGGELKPILGASSSGWDLFVKDSADEKQLQLLLKNTLQGHPLQAWSPRWFKERRSYWHLPIATQGPLGFFLAKKRGEHLVHPVPLDRFGLHVEGVPPQQPVIPETDN